MLYGLRDLQKIGPRAKHVPVRPDHHDVAAESIEPIHKFGSVDIRGCRHQGVHDFRPPVRGIAESSLTPAENKKAWPHNIVKACAPYGGLNKQRAALVKNKRPLGEPG